MIIDITKCAYLKISSIAVWTSPYAATINIKRTPTTARYYYYYYYYY